MGQIQGYDPGFHNRDLEATRGRLVKGGSWKRQRTVMIIPSADLIHAQVYLSHLNLMWPPNQGVFRYVATGEEVGKAYSDAIDGILAHPELSTWEYVLTVEHDNLPPPDGAISLIARLEAHPEYHCIGGLYYTKGHAGVAQIWGDPKDPQINFRPQVPVPDQLVETVGTGMGFNVWRMSMFRELAANPAFHRPFFKTKASIADGGVGTQDLAFWGQARPLGYRAAIDCAVRVGHLDYNPQTKETFVW
jgi:hypothetical protein